MQESWQSCCQAWSLCSLQVGAAEQFQASRSSAPWLHWPCLVEQCWNWKVVFCFAFFWWASLASLHASRVLTILLAISLSINVQGSMSSWARLRFHSNVADPYFFCLVDRSRKIAPAERAMTSHRTVSFWVPGLAVKRYDLHHFESCFQTEFRLNILAHLLSLRTKIVHHSKTMTMHDNARRWKRKRWWAPLGASAALFR